MEFQIGNASTKKTLSDLLNGHSGISPDMAIRLSKAFGGSFEGWLQMQMNYDAAQAIARADEIKVNRLPPVEA